MNFKMKALLAGALMVGSMSAQAAIALSDATSNSELVFSVYSGSKSYSLDTGITWSNFISSVNSGTTWSFTAPFSTAQTSGVFNTGTSGYANWYNNTLTASERSAGLNYNLIAADSRGATVGIITSATANGLPVNTGQTDGQTRTMISLFDNMAADLNVSMAAGASQNGSAVSAQGASGFAGAINGDWGGNLVGALAAAPISTSMYLYRINAADQLVNPSTFSQFAFNSNPYTVSFDGNTLSIATVAAVPEVDTSAMILAGIGLMGFIARRRKNSNI